MQDRAIGAANEEKENEATAVIKSPAASLVIPPIYATNFLPRNEQQISEINSDPSQVFQSSEMKRVWDYIQENPINTQVETAAKEIIRAFKRTWRLICEDRPPEDDGIERSFNHVYADLILNAAIALMRFDKAKASPKGKIAPWAIHYKSQLSGLMGDSAKALLTMALGEEDYNFETNKIFHIQDQKIELTPPEDVIVSKAFFTSAKKTIDGAKSLISSFDSYSQIILMVCCGFKEPLGDDNLKNTIFYYISIFKCLYQMQVEKQNQKSPEEKPAQIKQLDTKNITILLTRFDGVDVPKAEVEEADRLRLSQWKKRNLPKLKEPNDENIDYSGVNIVEFSEFEKTAFFRAGKYMIDSFIIDNVHDLIRRKRFEEDIRVYLAKVAGDKAFKFERVPQGIHVETSPSRGGEGAAGLPIPRGHSPSASGTTSPENSASSVSSLGTPPLTSSPQSPSLMAGAIHSTPPNLVLREEQVSEVIEQKGYGTPSGSPVSSPDVFTPRSLLIGPEPTSLTPTNSAPISIVRHHIHHFFTTATPSEKGAFMASYEVGLVKATFGGKKKNKKDKDSEKTSESKEQITAYRPT